jgi:DNA invertase Pin-like site-specific DNA recombinase
MTLVESEAVEMVFVYRLDRLTRNLHDSLHILESFREHGVELHIITAPDLGSAATDHFLLNLMGAFAEFERDMIRSRITDSITARKKRGLRLAGLHPYGYDTDPQTKQLVPNETESLHVAAIFEHAVDGMLPSDIAALINELGWRTKQYTTKRTGKVRGGNPWTPRQILDLLKNPVYIGCFRDGDKLRRGVHQPIVTREVFDMAADRIAERRTHSKKRRPPQKHDHFHLRGKIRCVACGRIMSTHQSKSGSIIYPHYRCRSHAGGRPPCKGSALPAYQVECFVDDTLLSPDFLDSFPGVSKEQRKLLERFQVAWSATEQVRRRHLLPAVVKEMAFDHEKEELSMTFDMDGITGLAQITPVE